MQTIERARRYLSKCPPAISGQGGHNATFRVATILVRDFALSHGDALSLLREWNQECVPPWTERELTHKVSSALGTPQHHRGSLLRHRQDARAADFHGLSRRRVVACDYGEAARSFLKGFSCGEADLWEASPLRLDGEPKLDGARIIEALYLPGERINFVTEFETTDEKDGSTKARPKGKGVTLERDSLVKRFQKGTDSSEAGGWLRMNPTDGKGIGDGNIAAFRWALLESDSLPPDLQLALFARLPLPIAAILSSGGRSFHAWVRVDAKNIEEYRTTVRRLLDLVGRFGVDGKNKNPSRLSRLPGATRTIGAVGDGVQRLLYLNPQPYQRRIIE